MCACVFVYVCVQKSEEDAGCYDLLLRLVWVLDISLACVCVCVCVQKSEGDAGCCDLLLSTFIPLRQGLLLNPELAWWPASPSNPPVSNPPSSGVTDTSNCAWLFM